MGFVQNLLVFFHLLGMASLVAAFLLQLRAKEKVNAGWLHGSALQLITGVALVLLAPATDADYDHAKIGVKTVVLLLIGGLAVFFAIKRRSPNWLNPTLGVLVLVNVALAVFWG